MDGPVPSSAILPLSKTYALEDAFRLCFTSGSTSDTHLCRYILKATPAWL